MSILSSLITASYKAQKATDHIQFSTDRQAVTEAYYRKRRTTYGESCLELVCVINSRVAPFFVPNAKRVHENSSYWKPFLFVLKTIIRLQNIFLNYRKASRREIYVRYVQNRAASCCCFKLQFYSFRFFWALFIELNPYISKTLKCLSLIYW